MSLKEASWQPEFSPVQTDTQVMEQCCRMLSIMALPNELLAECLKTSVRICYTDTEEQ